MDFQNLVGEALRFKEQLCLSSVVVNVDVVIWCSTDGAQEVGGFVKFHSFDGDLAHILDDICGSGQDSIETLALQSENSDYTTIGGCVTDGHELAVAGLADAAHPTKVGRSKRHNRAALKVHRVHCIAGGEDDHVIVQAHIRKSRRVHAEVEQVLVLIFVNVLVLHVSVRENRSFQVLFNLHLFDFCGKLR